MEISGYAGEIFWDLDRPSGQHSREMSLDNIRRHVPKFRPRIDLKSGLTRTYRWLEEYYGSGTARL